jgi:hypothetical protein
LLQLGHLFAQPQELRRNVRHAIGHHVEALLPIGLDHGRPRLELLGQRVQVLLHAIGQGGVVGLRFGGQRSCPLTQLDGEEIEALLQGGELRVSPAQRLVLLLLAADDRGQSFIQPQLRR